MMCLDVKLCSLMFAGVVSRTGHQSHRAQRDSCVSIVYFMGQMRRAPLLLVKAANLIGLCLEPKCQKTKFGKGNNIRLIFSSDLSCVETHSQR